MDDAEFTDPSDPAQLCRIAQFHEAGMRDLHKRLRSTGCYEASQAALESADLALAAARALAPEMPPLYPRGTAPSLLRELHAAG